MFGNIMNTIISATKTINLWGELHFRNLHSDKFKPYEDPYFEDVMLLENLFDAWYQSQNFPFMTVKYEGLYNKKTLQMLNDFVGFNIEFPPFKKRETDWSTHCQRNSVLDTYKNLNEKIEKADECKIWK